MHAWRKRTSWPTATTRAEYFCALPCLRTFTMTCETHSIMHAWGVAQHNKAATCIQKDGMLLKPPVE